MGPFRFDYLALLCTITYTEPVEGIWVATSEAKLRANKKHQQEKLEEIKFRVPKGEKVRIQTYAAARGESTNAFIYRVVKNAMEDGENT